MRRKLSRSFHPWLSIQFGGGIDQDNSKSPFGYPDRGIYVTQIQPDSPAAKGGLQLHDKILQFEGWLTTWFCSLFVRQQLIGFWSELIFYNSTPGYDFTMVTHSQAQKMIEKKSQKKPALGFIVYRAGLGQPQQSKMLWKKNVDLFGRLALLGNYYSLFNSHF